MMQGQLGPHRLAAEVLADIAHRRLSGTLSLQQGASAQELQFAAGRPESASGASDRAQVIQTVRGTAVLSSGQYEFREGDAVAGTQLGIDTLGEVLVALLRNLKPDQVAAYVAARANGRVSMTERFARIAQAIAHLGGPALPELTQDMTLGRLVAGANEQVRRAWTAALMLGGLQADGGGADSQVAASATATGRVPAVTASLPTEHANVPEEVEARRVYFEVRKAETEFKGRTHYEFLEVGPRADVEQVRRAYFERAKRWHTDRFAGLKLDEETRRIANNLFKAAEEAFRVLSAPEERRKYDEILEKQARGLPTDPKVIAQAQQAFSRGARMVQQGNGAGAEPLLKEAVDLNPGEAEYWIYYGYAFFCAKGHAVVTQAREHIEKGRAMREGLDVAHEFLGRIARVEGDAKAAEMHFKNALERNPNNVGAKREMRLLRMRGGNERQEKRGLAALLDKVLKRGG